MKNIRVKKCAMFTAGEFARLLDEIFGKDAVIAHYETDGISFENKASDEEITNEIILSRLSENLGVEVTSVHIDDCDTVGVWVCYKDINNLKVPDGIELGDVVSLEGNCGIVKEINSTKITLSSLETVSIPYIIVETTYGDEKIRRHQFKNLKKVKFEEIRNNFEMASYLALYFKKNVYGNENVKVHAFGPFGLRSEVTFFVVKDKKVLLFHTITYSDDKWFRYDTKEISGEPLNEIVEKNHLNAITEELPKTLEEAIEVLRVKE